MNHLTRPKSHTQHRNAAAFRSRTQLITMCEITNKMLQNKVASLPKENMFSIFIIGKFCYLVDGYYNCSGKKVVFCETMACLGRRAYWTLKMLTAGSSEMLVCGYYSTPKIKGATSAETPTRYLMN